MYRVVFEGTKSAATDAVWQHAILRTAQELCTRTKTDTLVDKFMGNQWRNHLLTGEVREHYYDRCNAVLFRSEVPASHDLDVLVC